MAKVTETIRGGIVALQYMTPTGSRMFSFGRRGLELAFAGERSRGWLVLDTHPSWRDHRLRFRSRCLSARWHWGAIGPIVGWVATPVLSGLLSPCSGARSDTVLPRTRFRAPQKRHVPWRALRIAAA